MHRPLALALGVLAGTAAIQSARLAAAVGGTPAVVVALALVGVAGLWSGRRIVQRRARGVRWALAAAVLAVPVPTLADGASWSSGQVSAYLALAAATVVTVHRRPVARPALRLVRSEA